METASPKTRIAPTPSGFLHIGNAYSFLLTALTAHVEGADILLRIDDLDRARYQSRYADDIFRTLDWLGIECGEGPESTSELEKEWSQQHRMELYRKTLKNLEDADLIFACRCSRKEVGEFTRDGGYPGTCRDSGLPLKAKKTAIRLKTDERSLERQNWTGEKKMDYLPAPLRDFVVRRKDGIPSYQLASVVDDLHFGIDLIVRGQDLYDSSLAQLYLADVMKSAKFSKARFVHHPLITTPGGEKLSKSAGAEALAMERNRKPENFYRKFSQWLGLSEEATNLQDLKALFSKDQIQVFLSGPAK